MNMSYKTGVIYTQNTSNHIYLPVIFQCYIMYSDLVAHFCVKQLGQLAKITSKPYIFAEKDQQVPENKETIHH